MTQKNRTPLQTRDFRDAPDLKRPLNDALADVYARLDALEMVAGLFVLPPITIQTGAVVGPLLAPFPVSIATPKEFTPKGVVVLKVDNLTYPGPLGYSTSGHFAHWDPVSEVDGRIVLRLVTGLAVSAQYRILLGALRGD